MSIGGSIETIGENVEFSVGTAGTEVTVYFNGEDGTKTSSDDTATSKYTDTYGTVKAFCLRTDQALTVVSMNGIDFTDPISIVKNTTLTEKFDSPILFKMKIKTTTDNTNIKLRIRGRGQ